MNANSHGASRRFQFSLSTLLIAVILIPLLIGLGMYASFATRFRAELIEANVRVNHLESQNDLYRKAIDSRDEQLAIKERSISDFTRRCDSHCLPLVPEAVSGVGLDHPFVSPVNFSKRVFTCSGAMGIHKTLSAKQFAQWNVGAGKGGSGVARIEMPGKRFIDGQHLYLAGASQVISAEICALLPRTPPERAPTELQYVLWLSLGWNADQSRYAISLEPLSGKEVYELESNVLAEHQPKQDDKLVLFRVIKRPAAGAKSGAEVFALTLDYSKLN